MSTLRSLLRSTLLLAASIALVAAPVSAQRTVQYDTIAEETPAAVTCGFCGGEKFGVVFRQLAGDRGLREDEFPLTVRNLQLALASATVGLSDCQGSTTGGMVSTQVAIYSGESHPTGSIEAMPPDGPWPGESLVWTDTVAVERSVATTEGGAMYNVMFNEFDLPGGGVRVDPPATYLRVVVSIPSGTATWSESCDTLTQPQPAGFPFRDDDGRVASEVNFIFANETNLHVPPLDPIMVPEGWYWNESTPAGAINGDWGIRLNITPNVDGPMTDAGTPMPDGGVDDAGAGDGGPVAGMDAGTGPEVDAGVSGCAIDGDCAGGEVCREGMCQRVSCSADTDCAGGQACVEGRCRNLCSNDSDCAGGEVCGADGRCQPVSPGTDDGGCGCRVTSPASGGAPLLGLIGLGLIVAIRRRRRR